MVAARYAAIIFVVGAVVTLVGTRFSRWDWHSFLVGFDFASALILSILVVMKDE